MTHEVFITYSSHDKPIAEAVCARLESRHIRCWIAPRDVLPGTEWAEAIVDAIDGSRVLVLVLSSSSNSSPQVLREVGRAAGKGIPIVPLRIDDVPLSKAMEFFVSSHHWLDAQTPPLGKHLQRLADTVQQLLTQEGETRESTEIPKEKLPISVERPAQAIKVKTKPIWFWAGIALLFAGLGTLAGLTGEFAAFPTGNAWYVDFVVMTMFALLFVVPGIYCLRRGITQDPWTGAAERKVPNWWWSLPVVLGFVGGIISWVKQKDVNWRQAMNMLTLGIIATLFWTIPFLVLQAPVTRLTPTPAPIPPPLPPPPAPSATPVTFPDSNLEAAIREAVNKPEGPIYIWDLESLTTLVAQERGISNLTRLEYCANLGYLNLIGNDISDLSSLAGLTNLRELRLRENNISDISPVAALANLQGLYLGQNNISDISPLAGLANLRVLYLYQNNIMDISPLAGLTNLQELYLGKNNISDISPLVDNSGLSRGDIVNLMGNPLSTTSANVYIPELKQRGVNVLL